MTISAIAAEEIAEAFKIDDVDALRLLIIKHTSIDSFYRELKNLRSAYETLKNSEDDRDSLAAALQEFSDNSLKLIQKYYMAANA